MGRLEVVLLRSRGLPSGKQSGLEDSSDSDESVTPRTSFKSSKVNSAILSVKDNFDSAGDNGGGDLGTGGGGGSPLGRTIFRRTFRRAGWLGGLVAFDLEREKEN